MFNLPKYILTMSAMTAFRLWVCSFQIYSGLMKWDALNKIALKKDKSGNFKIVVTLLYAHNPIFFF